MTISNFYRHLLVGFVCVIIGTDRLSAGADTPKPENEKSSESPVLRHLRTVRLSDSQESTEEDIAALELASDQTKLFAGLQDGRIVQFGTKEWVDERWLTSPGSEQNSFGVYSIYSHHEWMIAVHYSLFSGGNESYVSAWKTDQNEPASKVRVHGHLQCATFNPHSKVLAVLEDSTRPKSQRTYQFQLSTIEAIATHPKETSRVPYASTSRLADSGDGATMFRTTRDSRIVQSNLQGMSEEIVPRTDLELIEVVSLDKGANIMLCGNLGPTENKVRHLTSGVIEKVCVANGKTKWRFTNERYRIFGCRVTSDALFVVAFFGTDFEDPRFPIDGGFGEIVILRCEDGKVIERVTTKHSVTLGTLSKDSRMLVTSRRSPPLNDALDVWTLSLGVSSDAKCPVQKPDSPRMPEIKRPNRCPANFD